MPRKAAQTPAANAARRRLDRAAKRRAKAIREREEATASLVTEIRAAIAAGVPVTEIADRVELSRVHVYELLRQRE